MQVVLKANAQNFRHLTLFSQKMSNCQFTVYICSYFVQVVLNANAQNFQLQTLRRKWSQFSTSNFTMTFLPLFEVTKF